ncbi:IclR family transcriptional regulator [Raineyella sp. LH-20]|uniref:IclR family transcriptional regulator n=1 Tax=Raineyella sp. LH-20 TaxID=3081204 RepID=UPI002953B5A4|nr:IclR family transcriptional regulator [Raineyella sp. LH-20]WOP17425.1 IclR family transcriptional regulator [Raineyella sp. LH-20]
MTTSADAFPSAPEYTEAPQYPIESVDNALRLLLLLSTRRSLRLTDASHYLDVASSTAHRLLAMLQYRGFVHQDPVSRAYEPGPSLDRIAFALLRRLDIREQARPTLERLNERTGETVHLGALDGTEVRFLESIESPRAVRVGSRLGRILPAHCTSTGKAMLAGLSEVQLRVLYPSEQLPQVTSHSLATRTDLLAELAQVRARGYASSAEESEDGVCSVAAAVPNSIQPVAVNVSIPINRMTPARLEELAELVRDAATEIAAELN